jgi:hypothetical protein
MASPRHEDGLSSPANHAGVHKSSMWCALRHLQLEVRFQGVEDLLEVVCSGHAQSIGIQQVEAA